MPAIACLGSGCTDGMEKRVARRPFHQQPRDTEYWLPRSPSQRLDAVDVWIRRNPENAQRLRIALSEFGFGEAGL